MGFRIPAPQLAVSLWWRGFRAWNSLRVQTSTTTLTALVVSGSPPPAHHRSHSSIAALPTNATSASRSSRCSCGGLVEVGAEQPGRDAAHARVADPEGVDEREQLTKSRAAAGCLGGGCMERAQAQSAHTAAGVRPDRRKLAG